MTSRRSKYADARASLDRPIVGQDGAGIRRKLLGRAAPDQESAPALRSAPDRAVPAPRTVSAADVESAPDLRSALAAETGYTRVPNALLDSVLPRLGHLEQIVYLRLYRLSHGFHRDTCTVGMPALAKACNANERAIRRVIRRLEDLRLVETVRAELAALGARGNVYRVAGGAPDRRSAPDAGSAPDRTAAAGVGSANKENPKESMKTLGFAKAALHEYRMHHKDASDETARQHLLAWAEEAGHAVTDEILAEAIKAVR